MACDKLGVLLPRAANTENDDTNCEVAHHALIVARQNRWSPTLRSTPICDLSGLTESTSNAGDGRPVPSGLGGDTTGCRYGDE